MTLDKHKVKLAAQGRWSEIFHHLAPTLKDALARPGRHVACPVHGGENGFRLFRQFNLKGDCICNTCGARTDGFATLCWVNGWTFDETVQRVGEFLGMSPEVGHNLLAQPKEFEGKIIFKGMIVLEDRKVFGCRIKTERGVRSLYGKELRALIQENKVHLGENVKITLTGLYRTNGVLKKSWLFQRLDSDAQIRAKQMQAQALARKKAQAISQIWERSIPLTEESAATRYLSNRGITAEAIQGLQDIRFDRESCALVAAIRSPEGELVTVHCTALTEDGRKADVPVVKRILSLPKGTISGGAIRLGEDSAKGILAVAEGIETAASVSSATGLPCWATVSAVGMKSVQIPESVKIVLIFADKDRSETGQRAAKHLADRLGSQGKLAVVLVPSQPLVEDAKGIDWNDVLRYYGAEAFPVGV